MIERERERERERIGRFYGKAANHLAAICKL